MEVRNNIIATLKDGTVGTVNLREVNNVRSIVLENMKVDRSFMVSNLFYYADIQQDNDTMVRLYDIYY